MTETLQNETATEKFWRIQNAAERTLSSLTVDELYRILAKGNEFQRMAVSVFCDAEDSTRCELLAEGCSVPRSRFDVYNEAHPVYGPELPWFKSNGQDNDEVPF